MCNNLACNLGRRAPRPPCSQVLVLAVQQGTALRRRIRRRPDPVRWANDVVEVDTEEDAAYQLLLQVRALCIMQPAVAGWLPSRLHMPFLQAGTFNYALLQNDPT